VQHIVILLSTSVVSC